MSFLFQVFYIFLVLGVEGCYYIFFKILDQIWVSDDKRNFVLINIIGNNLYYIKGLFLDEDDLNFNDSRDVYGVYIVNSDGEMIYIDVDNNIKKILNKLEIIIVIKVINVYYMKLCVYWFLLIWDLLFGLDVIKKKIVGDSDKIGMVDWYNQSGELL